MEGEAEIKDLDALEAACTTLGLELVRGKTEYRWYGQFMGDAKLPDGVKVEDLGKCEHAIRVSGNSRAYEVGLVRNAAGTGWVFRYDYWDGGRGLMEKVSKDGKNGKDCLRLIHEYSAVKSIRRAQKLGYRHKLERAPNGMPRKLTLFR